MLKIPRTLSLILGLALAVTALVAPADSASSVTSSDSAAARAFERFKALEGEWQGTTNRGDSITLSYQVVAEGTAVLERERIGGAHEMLTLYHLDGERLMLTHYCATGNQPRMAADGANDGAIRFELVDVTGLATPAAGHMHRAVFELSAQDRLHSAWTWRENGEDAFVVEVDAKRVR